MIRYVKGDATQPIGDGPKIIVHCCNDMGRWGAGFTGALSKRWTLPEETYRAWAKEPTFKRGEVQLVPVARDLWVANLIGQRGVRLITNKKPVDYLAIREGLEKIWYYSQRLQPSLHMPRIGCGLAGGDWGMVEPILVATTPEDRTVIVYDL